MNLRDIPEPVDGSQRLCQIPSETCLERGSERARVPERDPVGRPSPRPRMHPDHPGEHTSRVSRQRGLVDGPFGSYTVRGVFRRGVHCAPSAPADERVTGVRLASRAARGIAEDFQDVGSSKGGGSHADTDSIGRRSFRGSAWKGAHRRTALGQQRGRWTTAKAEGAGHEGGASSTQRRWRSRGRGDGSDSPGRTAPSGRSGPALGIRPSIPRPRWTPERILNTPVARRISAPV